MKTLNYLKAILFFLAINFFVSCEKNQAPSCNFVQPIEGYTVTKGDIVSISLSAEDSDGVVSELRLFINEIGLASLEFPYNYELDTEEYESGEYTLKATAKDGEGLEASDEVKIIIDAKQLSVRTDQATFTRYKTATLEGELSFDGELQVEETGFYFGTSSNPETTGTRILVGSSLGNISTVLNDLVPGEIYFYAAFGVYEAGEALGNELTFELPDVELGSFTDPRDQVVYGSVKIGDQVWMSENLKAVVYNDGSPIPHIDDNTAWSNNTGAAYCWYDNDDMATEKGALYNWYVVETEKLCPSGWHVPSDEEWRQFEYYLGMDAVLANTDGFRGTNEGGMLKTTTQWDIPNTGATNELQFSLMPNGRRDVDGTYLFGTYTAYLWLSDLGAYNHPQRRHFRNDEGRISRSVALREHALSVRCVKD